MFKKLIIYILIIFSLKNYYHFFTWYLGNDQMIIEEAFMLSLQASLPMFLAIFLIHYYYYPRDNTGHASVISFPPIILLFFINAGFTFSTLNMYHLQLYKVPELFDLFRHSGIGLLLIIISLVIFSISLNAFNKANENPIPTSSTELIIFRSIYGYSRNPMYLSMLLIQIGMGMLLSMVHIVFFTLFTYIVLKYYVIIPEEKYLEEKFSQSYINYKKSVRRWV